MPRKTIINCTECPFWVDIKYPEHAEVDVKKEEAIIYPETKETYCGLFKVQLEQNQNKEPIKTEQCNLQQAGIDYGKTNTLNAIYHTIMRYGLKIITNPSLIPNP